MSSHFQDYAQNLNRMAFLDMIDHQAATLRYSQARASLIFNPLSGLPYEVVKPTQRFPAIRAA